MTTFGPPVPSSGPLTAKIFILAEAPGEEETALGSPLVGASGQLLRSMLAKVGVGLDDCYKATVFSRRPSGNNLALFGVEKGQASPQAVSLGPLTANPQTFLADQWLPELDRLREELAAVNPNIVIALGNTATWALLSKTGIGALRGSIAVSDFLPGRALKVLPTYHPAAVFRQWNWLTVLIADLEKASANANSPEFHYDNTAIWLAPTLADLDEFARLHLDGCTELSVDIETKRGQITCLSFVPEASVALVIPFWIEEGPDPNYWPDLDQELSAWAFVRRWMQDPRSTKVGQNFIYDTQYFLRYGITPVNSTEDTMLMHHSLYSELQKGLGFLGSIYSNTQSWKSMRTYRLEELTKKDD